MRWASNKYLTHHGGVSHGGVGVRPKSASTSRDPAASAQSSRDMLRTPVSIDHLAFASAFLRPSLLPATLSTNPVRSRRIQPATFGHPWGSGMRETPVVDQCSASAEPRSPGGASSCGRALFVALVAGLFAVPFVTFVVVGAALDIAVRVLGCEARRESRRFGHPTSISSLARQRLGCDGGGCSSGGCGRDVAFCNMPVGVGGGFCYPSRTCSASQAPPDMSAHARGIWCSAEVPGPPCLHGALGL